MARLRWSLQWALAGATLALLLVAGAVLFFTRTEAGVQRAGQYVVDRLRGAVHGELEVAGVRSRGLLRGVTLDGIRITGPDGRLFLRADSARLAYDILTLLGGDVAFNRLTLYRPEVHLERLPGAERWNFQEIFPEDPEPDAPDNIVLIEDATVHEGRVIIRIPRDGNRPPSERELVEEVPGGEVRVVRFENLDGRIPRIVWQTPEAQGRIIDIARLSGHAYLWDTAAEVRDVQGTVTVRDSIVTFNTPTVDLPASRLSALGQVVIRDDGDHLYDLEARSERMALRDLQWLYPLLPDEGGGSLRLRIQSRRPGTILWLAEDARLSTPGTELTGSFGVITGDTLYFTNVNLRASPLDLELIQRMLPVELPVDGLLMGTLEVEGPISSLWTRGDLRYRSLARGGARESAARWSGRVRAEPPYSLESLDADVRRLDLSQLGVYTPGLRLVGLASGRIRAHGSLADGLDLSGRFALDRDGVSSRVQGGGRIRFPGSTPTLDLRLEASPVALYLLGEQFPALVRLAGEAAGPVTVSGALDDLHIEADLVTTAGALAFQGRVDVTAPEPAFRAEGGVTEFRLDRLVTGLPETTITGRFDLDGSGTALADLDARLALDLVDGEIAGVGVHAGRLRAAAADGLARVDTLNLSIHDGWATASGTFGLVAGREGTLLARVELESLTPFEAALRSVENGAQDPGNPRLAGAARAAARLSGSLADWRVQAEVVGRDLLHRDVSLARARGDFDWSPSSLRVDATLDTLRAGQRTVPSLLGTVRLEGGVGDLTLIARGPGQEELEVEAGFEPARGTVTLRLRELALALGAARWTLQEEATGRVGRDGFAVDSLVLRRTPDPARIRVAGVLPWRQPGDDASRTAALAVDVEGLNLAEALALAQVDAPLQGELDASLRVTGTALAPLMHASVAARPFRYDRAALDSVAGHFLYAERLLTGRLMGWNQGRSILEADAAIPVELALTDRAERWLDRPVRVRALADQLPAGLLSFVLPGLLQVEGTLDGTVTWTGTGSTPELDGELRLAGGAAFVDGLNVHFHDIAATARGGDGSRLRIDADLRSDQGAATARGTVELTRVSDPAFDLNVSARRLDASRRRDVTAIADGEIHLGGRYTRPVVSGNVRLLTGEMNLDELLRQYQIVQLDNSLFQMFDDTPVGSLPAPLSPFLENMVLDGLIVSAQRNVWLRSRELNVEVAGNLDVAFDRQRDDLRITGALEALRGSYQLQVLERLPTRRFEIRHGSINFVGTPGIDPNLDITAGYRVRRAQGDPLDVVATVTGTLQQPRIRLTSDSDPPVSETDIASFLLFGRSTLELSQAEADVVSSMREGMLGLARPVVLGLASTQLQQVFVNLGLPFDYLSLTAPEYGLDDYSRVMTSYGGLGVLQGTQVEAGFYAHRNVFVLGSFSPFSPALGGAAEPESLFRPGWGARVEFRLTRSWTLEGYWEDRFARTPSFSYDEIHDRTVRGLSLFREWGY
jgi:translocation and assembly module TamB